MNQARVAKKTCESKPEGRRKMGGPKLTSLKDADNDLEKLKVVEGKGK
jgi:hypothetical protein